ncbi:serine hydrolase [Zunongwangia sp.]|uniref:serine hydrolase n=1 Tax=Zunongwangia sp. TaxID=1965325 RepID=UPI003AA90D32
MTFGQENENRLNGIDQEIETLLKSYNAVGLSIAIVENNKIIYSKGFGYRNLEDKLLTTENTVFQIGSVTKAFTASLLGILETNDIICLKEKPSSYISELQFYNDKMNDLIKIEDLLSHKSGLGSLDGSLILFPENDKLKTIKRLKYLKPNGEINDSWIYSNMGYTIAGAIVEQVTSKSWDNNVKTKIFSPLNMNHSFTDLKEMKKTNNFSFGYGMSDGRTEKVLYEDYYSYSPAGAIKSTSNDMANWIMTWLNNGQFDKQQVIPENYIKNATKIHNIRPQDGADSNVYLFGDGFGWRVESFKGHYKVHHGGNTSGFSSQVVMYPNEKLGIVVLTNQHSSILPYIIADVITNRMLDLSKTELNQYPVVVNGINKIDREIKELNKDKTSTNKLSEFCGKYSNKGYGTFEIIQENNSLYVVFPTYKFRLEHLEYDIFVMKQINEIPQVMNPEFAMNFSTDSNGNISGLK